jgi:hypothetical protein
MLLYLKNKNKKSPPCMDQDQARETYGRGSLTLWLPATVFFFFFFFFLLNLQGIILIFLIFCFLIFFF